MPPPHPTILSLPSDIQYLLLSSAAAHSTSTLYSLALTNKTFFNIYRQYAITLLRQSLDTVAGNFSTFAILLAKAELSKSPSDPEDAEILFAASKLHTLISALCRAYLSTHAPNHPLWKKPEPNQDLQIAIAVYIYALYGPPTFSNFEFLEFPELHDAVQKVGGLIPIRDMDEITTVLVDKMYMGRSADGNGRGGVAEGTSVAKWIIEIAEKRGIEFESMVDPHSARSAVLNAGKRAIQYCFCYGLRGWKYSGLMIGAWGKCFTWEEVKRKSTESIWKAAEELEREIREVHKTEGGEEIFFQFTQILDRVEWRSRAVEVMEANPEFEHEVGLALTAWWAAN